MLRPLTRHPDSPCAALARIEVEALRPQPGALALRYVATGAVDGLVLPPPAAGERTDGLWRHTCFEAFVRAGEGEAYRELNFAPSTQWAAYRFDGYRLGMAPAQVTPPRIEVSTSAERLETTVSLALPDLPPDAPWRVGLTAVIEEAGGRISHWSLAHPPGPADFHHARGFALDLRLLERP